MITCSTRLSIALASLLLVSCEGWQSKDERLTKKYCSSCHQYVEPGMLDKRTWEKEVLPHMAFRMGISVESRLGEIASEDMYRVLATLPPKPMVTDDEWNLIRNYIISNAPDSLISNQPAIDRTVAGFVPEKHTVSTQRFVTLIQYDTATRTTLLGTRSSRLYRLDTALRIVDSVRLASPPSHISFTDNRVRISLMGIMDPNDQAKGKIVDAATDLQQLSTLIDSLQRPAHFLSTDLNNDGREDHVVCSFGNYTGQLEIYEGRGNGVFGRHIISYFPGARKVISRDVNSDGLPDLVALMTQGNERLILFINKGNFDFHQKTLLQFPAVYGSSYFELADFNADGHFDILYTNGDNADYSMVLKPYHAVRVFENDGKNNFTEKWSFPMHGASEAETRDYDQDGDLDIAAISFFPDNERHPEQSFIYFENKGGYEFEPRVTSHAVKGRWLVLESADFDNDSDIDIILGSGNFNLPPGADKTLTFLLLRNELRKKLR